MKILFYDGSCKLCRREIDWLRVRLKRHLRLTDISQEGFTGFAGTGKRQMMQKIHLWLDDHFVTGIDATLYYWRIAGLGFWVSILKFPPCYWVAEKAYNFWASKRNRCNDDSCG